MDTKLAEKYFKESVQLSTEIVDFLKSHDEKSSKKIMVALAICFGAIAKGTNVSLHSAVELLMIVYKNTEVVDDEM